MNSRPIPLRLTPARSMVSKPSWTEAPNRSALLPKCLMIMAGFTPASAAIARNVTGVAPLSYCWRIS